jgi:pyruvate formate lyase activating enzyme
MRPECDGCYKCADICPSRAIKQWGEILTLDELMKIIEEDRSFYERSGGGVTLTGGEVMVQWEFAGMLLMACKEAGINTCVETALNCPPEHMEAIYQYTDLVIADIKHMNSKKHREYTGVGNELILGNIKRTAELGKNLVIRTPVIMGYNADDENIRAIAAFIRDELRGKITQYQLLPYRKMGTEKYDSLGQAYPMGDYAPPPREVWERELTRLADMLAREYGLPVSAGSAEKLNIQGVFEVANDIEAAHNIGVTQNIEVAHN